MQIDVVGPAPAPPLIRRAPELVDFVGTVPNTHSERRFEITTWEEDGSIPWIRELAASSSEWEIEEFELSSEADAPQGGVYRTYSIHVGTTIPSTRHLVETGSLEITATRPSQRLLTPIIVRRSLEPPIAAIPGELLFDMRSMQPRALQRTVILQRRDECRWEVESGESDVAWLKVTHGSAPGSGADDSHAIQRIVIEFDPGGLDENLPAVCEGTVLVSVSHPNLPKVHVPVTVHMPVSE